ncbi:MAG: recombination protein O N-terminal domain-containing protein [Planctomycetota bacterium]
MPVVTDQALCIRQWPWSETSQTALLLTHEHGLLRVLAKGSRRDKSPFSGGIEALTTGEAELIIKPTTGLTQLIAWDLREPLAHIRTDWLRFTAATYVAEVLGAALSEGDPHPSLHLDACRALSASDLPPASLVLFLQWATLNDTGHSPDLTPPDRAGDVVGFDAAAGRLVSDPGPAGPDAVWRARQSTIAAVHDLAAGAMPTDASAASRAIALLDRYLAWVLGRQFSSSPSMLRAFGPAAGEHPGT